MKEGRDIDLGRSLERTEVDYSNRLTKTTTEASLKLNEYLRKIINRTFKIVERLVS